MNVNALDNSLRMMKPAQRVDARELYIAFMTNRNVFLHI